jgi:hypothetical protein
MEAEPTKRTGLNRKLASISLVNRLIVAAVKQIDEWAAPAFRAAFAKMDEQDARIAELTSRLATAETRLAALALLVSDQERKR